MKAYIEYYQLSTGYIEGSIPPRFSDAHRKPIPACGDRSIIRLDGRNTSAHWHEIAAAEGLKRGYVGYKLIQGDSLLSTHAISEYETL